MLMMRLCCIRVYDERLPPEPGYPNIRASVAESGSLAGGSDGDGDEVVDRLSSLHINGVEKQQLGGRKFKSREEAEIWLAPPGYFHPFLLSSPLSSSRDHLSIRYCSLACCRRRNRKEEQRADL